MARLPSRVAIAVFTYVDERLCAHPHRLTGEMHGELAHLRSAHHGAYRVLVEIDEAREIVFIHRVDHRAHVYRPR